MRSSGKLDSVIMLQRLLNDLRISTESEETCSLIQYVSRNDKTYYCILITLIAGFHLSDSFQCSKSALEASAMSCILDI
jgi:uncharacterized membrane protein YbjE (DUF340 family)